jgi:arginine decarboxylase
MDQKSAPLADALAAIEKRPVIGFGALNHNQGSAIPGEMNA